jgi:hypothetical protein
MVELRWFIRQGWDGPEKVLQQRQQIDMNVYAGNGPFPDTMKNMQWSEWKDIPTVKDYSNE